MGSPQTYEAFCAERGLIAPAGLTDLLGSEIGERLDGLLYRPDVDDAAAASLSGALERLHEAIDEPPANLLPLLPVDDASVACAVCAPRKDPDLPGAGRVVRWHLGDIPLRHQHATIDSDASTYVKSVDEELRARASGLPRIKKIANSYTKRYGAKGARPPSWATRPVQLACQNVIVGLAAMAHESQFEGLRVPVFLTCEVPHLAAHEANRAMAALLLCDAFQSGGTMEIRFGPGRKELPVPAAMRRFGRVLGIELGAADRSAITPAEARELFQAVTPVPYGLRQRVDDLLDRGVVSPERICYSLLAPVWRDVELEYLIATSSRIESILAGGAPPAQRSARLAELEVARAALMVGMLVRHLDGTDAAAGDGGVRVFEDSRAGIEWAIHDQLGAVAMSNVPVGAAPWQAPGRDAMVVGGDGALVVVPRALPTPVDHELAAGLAADYPDTTVALLVPRDMVETVPRSVPVLACPDRLGELDIDVERRMQALRVGRT